MGFSQMGNSLYLNKIKWSWNDKFATYKLIGFVFFIGGDKPAQKTKKKWTWKCDGFLLIKHYEGMLQPVLGGYQKRDENQPRFQVDFHLEYLRVSLTMMPFLKVIKRLSLGWEPPISNLFHFLKNWYPVKIFNLSRVRMSVLKKCCLVW